MKVGQAFKEELVLDSYDAIVIGSGMGGMSASSLLAQAGKKVLLLEQHNVIGGCTQTFSRKGFEWSVGLHYVGDVHTERNLSWRLFDAVTRGGVKWHPLPSLYNRIVIEDRLYEIHASKEEFLAKMTEYFPQETDALQRYMQLVKEVTQSSNGYFADRTQHPANLQDSNGKAKNTFYKYSQRTVLEVLSEITQNKELIAVLCGNYGDYGVEPSRASFGVHAMLVSHYLNGACYPIGGSSIFAETVTPIIEEQGGKVLYNAKVKEIIIEEDNAVGVRLENGREIFANQIISNTGADTTYKNLMPKPNNQDSELQQLLQTVKPTRTAVGLNIGLSRSAGELGIHPANIWAHPGTDFDKNIQNHMEDFDNPFPWYFITFPSAKDPEYPSRFPNKATIEMYALTNFSHFEKWQGSQWRRRGEDYQELKEGIAKRLFEELFKYLPAIKDHIAYYEVSTPLTYQHFLNKPTGGFLGLEATPERFQQKWLRPHTPIANLYLTGQDVASDGIIGALNGGVMCASAILERNLMSEIIRKRYKKW
ncbi:MAG: NAD(P)/FAD-dependent oxidoreductase [Spirochaetota bacterium]